MICFSILISFSSIVHDIFHVYNIQIVIHTHAILHFYANKIILSVKQLHMAVSKEKIKQKYLDHWQIPIKCYGVGYKTGSYQLS